MFDKLFGTAYLPKDKHPTGFGIDDPVPSDAHLRHLAYPFTRAASGRAESRLPSVPMVQPGGSSKFPRSARVATDHGEAVDQQDCAHRDREEVEPRRVPIRWIGHVQREQELPLQGHHASAGPFRHAVNVALEPGSDLRERVRPRSRRSGARTCSPTSTRS